MLKEILKIQGVSELSKVKQLKISGGYTNISEEECNSCNGFYVYGDCVVDALGEACLNGYPPYENW